MDTLYLPFLSSADPLQFAIERMKQTDSRAIILENEIGEAALYMNRNIVQAWIDRVPICAGLQDQKYEESVAHLDREIHAPEPTNIFAILEKNLSRQGKNLGLLFDPQRGSRGITLVFTLHETHTERIKSANLACFCTNPDTPHDRNLTPPGRNMCDTCGFPFDCI